MHELRVALRLSQSALGEPLGVTYASVSRWEKGEIHLPDMAAIALEHLYGASAKWLLTGEGSMWVERATVHQESEFFDRPLIVGAAACGPGGEIQDPGPAATRYALRRDFAERILRQTGGGTECDLFFLLCRGESMTPTIRDEEMVLINTAMGVRENPYPNGIYLVKRTLNDEEARVKRIRIDKAKGELILSSDNRTFSPVTVALEHVPLPKLILGRVCWLGRYLIDSDPHPEDW